MQELDQPVDMPRDRFCSAAALLLRCDAGDSAGQETELSTHDLMDHDHLSAVEKLSVGIKCWLTRIVCGTVGIEHAHHSAPFSGRPATSASPSTVPAATRRAHP